MSIKVESTMDLSPHNYGLYHSNLPKLTTKESELYFLIQEEHLTPNLCMKRLGVKKSRYYAIRDSLIKKGYIKPELTTVENIEGGCPPLEGSSIRLHGEHFVIRIIHGHLDPKYKELVDTRTTYDGHTVIFHRDKIQLHSGKSFFGCNTRSAGIKAVKYWSKFGHRLENRYNLQLIKPQVTNWERVESEYARWNDKLAKWCKESGVKLRFFGSNDGKLWAEVDFSKGDPEFETKGKTAQDDMERVIEPSFNAWRDGHIPTPKDEWEMLAKLTSTVERLASQMQIVSVAVEGNSHSIQSILQMIKPENGITNEKVIPEYVG